MIVENPPKELIKIINVVINFLSALIFPAIYIPLVISVMPQITAGTMSFLNGITFMYADIHENITIYPPSLIMFLAVSRMASSMMSAMLKQDRGFLRLSGIPEICKGKGLFSWMHI